MLTARLCLSLLLLMSLMPIQAAAAEQAAKENAVAAKKENQVLVEYKEDIDFQEKAAVQSRLPEKTESAEPLGRYTEVLTFDSPAERNEVLAELKRDPHVKHAEKNRLSYVDTSANDPYFSKQWWLPLVQAPHVWNKVPDQKRVSLLRSLTPALNYTLIWQTGLRPVAMTFIWTRHKCGRRHCS